MAQAAAVLEREAADNGLTDLPLPASVQEVLAEMLQIVARESENAQQIEVYRTAASDEIESHLVISVRTDLPAADAFALWDRIGDAVQDWTHTLPEPQEDIALSIAVEVLWSVAHAAP